MPRRSDPAEPKAPAKPRARTTRRKAADKVAAGDGALIPAAEALQQLQEVTARLTSNAEALAQSLGETPKPDDFQPLADHLYEFARIAPPLLESLQEAPRAAEPIRASVQALQEVSETLQYTHESFNESLLRLPRAEDYEPLAEPLREFARVSPALAESLAEVLKVARPLAESVRGLQQLGDSLEHTRQELAGTIVSLKAPPATPGPPPGTDALAVERAADCMHAAGQAILAALQALPRDPAYTSLAAQLRELAGVSPSLMEWLAQVPTLTAPLTDSVETLLAVAADLEEGRQTLLESAASPPAAEQTSPAGQAATLLGHVRALRQRSRTALPSEEHAEFKRRANELADEVLRLQRLLDEGESRDA